MQLAAAQERNTYHITTIDDVRQQQATTEAVHAATQTQNERHDTTIGQLVRELASSRLEHLEHVGKPTSYHTATAVDLQNCITKVESDLAASRAEKHELQTVVAKDVSALAANKKE